MKRNFILSAIIGLLTIEAFPVDDVNTLSSVPLYMFLSFIILVTLFYYYKCKYRKNVKHIFGNDYILKLYFFWVAICCIRGLCIADNYWEYKALFMYSMSLLIPTFMLVFYNPQINRDILNFWFKVIFICFIVYTLFIYNNNVYSFILGPVFFIGCFLPLIPTKWRLIILVLLVLMVFIDFTARSQTIKAVVTLLFCTGCFFKKILSNRVLLLLHHMMYIIPFILLLLGMSGVFNVFRVDEYLNDKGTVDGEYIKDTRTFLYIEIIDSALKNDYVLWGRTPARGNDSNFFDFEMASKQKRERFQNEFVHPNIFTWTGLIGVFLYSLLYFRASYRGVTNSNNWYVRLLALYVSFRWMFGWIEDINNVDINNASLWMTIAICYSPFFRSMTDNEFEIWIRSIFVKEKKLKTMNSI